MTADLSHLPLTSNHWGTARIETTDGQITAVHPFEGDPDPSPINQALVDVADGPTRILRPAVRKSWLEDGPGSSTHLRGKEPFVEVSWETMNTLVAKEIRRVTTTYGNEAIFGGSYGWASAGRFHHAKSQLHRFLNCVGGFTRSLDTYSFAAGEVVTPHISGPFRKYAYEGDVNWSTIAEHAELVVAFGGIPLKNGQIGQGGLGRHVQRGGLETALDAGVHFVNVSPLAVDLTKGGSESAAIEQVAPRPGSDVALILALAHTLLEEQLHDQAFLEARCVGFETFASYLRGETDGEPKTPEWAAPLADIAPNVIRDLARRMAACRTLISTSWSMSRQDYGEQPFWAAWSLAAMLGQIDQPGTGIVHGLSAVNSVGSNAKRAKAYALPTLSNSVDRFIPVARISDMLLHPGEPFTYNGADYTYPDIRLMWWCGGNPFHHHQDLPRMMKAWQTPETIVVNDWCWNANAKFADIVLPATMPIERLDLQITPQDSLISIMSQVVEPIGEARNDHDIFAGFAAELGCTQAFTEGRSTGEWIEHIYRESKAINEAVGVEIPEWPDFVAAGFVELGDQTGHDAEPPSRRKLLPTPSGKIELHSDRVANFGYDDCPGHAAWIEPREWLGNATKAAPLHLLCNQPTTKLHSQFDQGSVSQAAKVADRERITMHPSAADVRGLDAGDLVRVFNERGNLLAGVVLDHTMRRDVVQMPTGAWFDPIEIDAQLWCKNGNPNVLTPDRGTSSLAQGPAAHSCLVQVEAYNGPDLPVTAYDRPELIPVSLSMGSAKVHHCLS